MKTAIVGAGTIGSVHAGAYRAAGAELVAVVEPVPEAAAAFAAAQGVRAYDTLESLLGSSDAPEVLSVCTPPYTHRAIVERALAAGIHVLCEKPMAHTEQDAIAIAAAAETARAVFATAYCHRFQPELEAIERSILDGAIGTPRMFYNSFSGNQPGIESRWFGDGSLSGGGVLIDAAIHSIDIFRFLCGEVTNASATMSSRIGAVELDVEHTAALGLLSDRGVVGTIDVSWKLPLGSAVVRVSGSEGALAFDYSKPGLVEFHRVGSGPEELQVPTADRFHREIVSFLEAVRSGGRPRTDARDGLAGIRVISHVYAQHTALQPH